MVCRRSEYAGRVVANMLKHYGMNAVRQREHKKEGKLSFALSFIENVSCLLGIAITCVVC